MKRYFGSIVFALLLILTLAPLGSAVPTRATVPEISGITVEGLIAPGGEYAVGPHEVIVTIETTGDYDFEQMNFTVEVRFENKDYKEILRKRKEKKNEREREL